MWIAKMYFTYCAYRNDESILSRKLSIKYCRDSAAFPRTSSRRYFPHGRKGKSIGPISCEEKVQVFLPNHIFGTKCNENIFNLSILTGKNKKNN